MSLPKSVPLRAANGKSIQIPSVGYGTWAAGDTSWAKDATLTALKEGYRHLDCAWMYGVDEAVGAAIKESGIPREEIFVTSKFWCHFGHPDNVEICLDKILKNMGLDYIDLFLAHWPCVWKPSSNDALNSARSGPDTDNAAKGYVFTDDGKPVVDWEHSTSNIAKIMGKEGSYVPTWKAMQECVKKGKTRSVGVSNFSITELNELLPHQDDVPLSCNQIEVHPWLPQTEMVEFAHKNGIVITCYSPFAGQPKKGGAVLVEDSTVVELAKKLDMGVGQLLQSWAVQRGTVPLGKSATPARIRSNLAIQKLSDEDMKTLDDMAKPDGAGRTVDPSEGWGLPIFKG